MFAIIPILLLLLSCLAAAGQTVISGKIKDTKGHPLGGASIAIKDTYDGGISDSLGNYHFRTTEKGAQTLLVTSIGYKLYEQKIEIAGATMRFDIAMKEEPSELKAVVITAGTFEASDTKRTTVLSPIDIVTTASANADVTAAIRTLPGAQQVGESGGLFVRGGTAEESKIFIDGTLANNFYFSAVPDIASRGRFSPFLFKGTVFSSGGYSALYGQALSSAVILESVDLPEQSSAQVGISPILLSAGLQELSKKKNSSWGVSYNYVNLAAYFAVVKQRPDNFKVPQFHTADANFRIKTSKTGIIKFYTYFNYGRLGLRRPDIDSSNLKDAFNLQNSNSYTNIAWREKLGKKWKMNLGVSYSYNVDDVSNALQDQFNAPVNINYEPYNSKDFTAKTKSSLAQVKAVFERKLYGLSAIRFGGEYMYFRDNSQFSNRYVSNLLNKTDDNFTAAFAEADIYVTNDIAAKVGTRVENSTQLNKANIVPRVSLAYKLTDKAQVSLAYGMFYQKPEKDYFLRAYAMNDLLYTKAVHYIANYQKVSRDYTLRIEAFYKKYGELVKTYSRFGGGITDSVANGGYGDAKEIELFWRDKKTLKNVDYWISYSYLDTKRDYLNYPYAIQPNFAAKHTANFVIKKFVQKWKTNLNATYTYATGRPYYNIRYDNGAGKFRVVDQGKTIDYHSLSFSVNYLPNVGNISATRFLVLVFSMNNVLGSNQVFGYNYSYDGTKREPILPTAKRFYFVGVFMSFGVDRSDDVINSNL